MVAILLKVWFPKATKNSNQGFKTRLITVAVSMYRWWNFLSHLISYHRKTFKVTEVVLSFNRVLLRITLRDCFKKVTKCTKHINMFTANCKNLLVAKKRIQILMHFHKFRTLTRNCTLMPTPVLILVSNKWFVNSRWQLPLLVLEISTLLIYN